MGHKVGHMTRSVARDIDHLHAEPKQCEVVCLDYRCERLGYGFARRAKHWRAGGLLKLRHASNVVGMVVGD